MLHRKTGIVVRVKVEEVLTKGEAAGCLRGIRCRPQVVLDFDRLEVISQSDSVLRDHHLLFRRG